MRISRGTEHLEEFSLTIEQGKVIRWPIGDLPPAYWDYRAERIRLVATALKCVTVAAAIGLLVAFADSATVKDLLELVKVMKEMIG